MLISMRRNALLCCLVFVGVLHAYTPPAAAVSRLGSYRGYSELTSAAGSMDIDTYTRNLITWQMPHGGFFKAYASKYVRAWNGTEARSDQVRNGTELGTIDNNATIQEMRLMAVRYKATGDATYKNTLRTAFQKAISFILTSQQGKGSWPQMYPARGNYSDMATYNDNAMVRVMVLAKDIVDGVSPFDSDIATDAQRTQLQGALDKSVDFALKAQIYNNGNPTVWCAQHDPNTYAPVEARSYELASKSGSESAGIVWFLMNWPQQTDSIQRAVKGAIAWYKKNRVADLRFSGGSFVASPGASLWYRFYEVHNDDYFFCDRAGVSTKTQDITQISDERREGYQWAGDYGSALLAAEGAYLSAIPALSSSSTAPSSSSQLVSSSSAPPISSSSIFIPTEAICSGTPCTHVLQGEDFCDADGVAENRNAGFLGTGYANGDNAQGANLGYALLADPAVNATLYIRYANGAGGARNARIRSGAQTLVADLAFPSTGGWTSWQTLWVTLNLPQGRDSLVFEPLTTDGLANIDWLGWMGENPAIVPCDAPTLLGGERAVAGALRARILDGRLYLQNAPQGPGALRIRDLSGKLLRESRGPNLQSLAVEALPHGVFLVQVEQGGQTIGSFVLAH